MAIPEWINCRRLKALLMTFEPSTPTPKIPSSFFNGMRDLRLLRIHGGIQSSSLHLPKQLRALHLHSCCLEKIALIVDLMYLEILSLRESNIKVLPNEIGPLAKLKLLDLSGCCDLKKLAPGILSRLVQLENLQLLGCPIEWEGVEKGKERRNASLDEVWSLRNLSTLDIWIQDIELIPEDKGHLQKLTSYMIQIGNGSIPFYPFGECIHQKLMLVQLNERKARVTSIPVLFAGAEDPTLTGTGWKDMIDLSEDLNNMEEIHHCL